MWNLIVFIPYPFLPFYCFCSVCFMRFKFSQSSWFSFSTTLSSQIYVVCYATIVILLWFLNVTCCYVRVSMVSKNVVIWIAAQLAFWFVVFCNLNWKTGENKCYLLLSIRGANWPPVWERAFYPVYRVCLSWTFAKMCLSIFPFDFEGGVFLFDCIKYLIIAYLLACVVHSYRFQRKDVLIWTDTLYQMVLL